MRLIKSVIPNAENLESVAVLNQIIRGAGSSALELGNELRAQNSTAEFSKTSDTTLATITGMSIPLAANKDSLVVFSMRATRTAGAADSKLAFALPTSATAAWINFDDLDDSFESVLDTAIGLFTLPTGDGSYMALGIINVAATPGNWEVQFAQFTSDANAHTVRAGAMMLAIGL